MNPSEAPAPAAARSARDGRARLALLADRISLDEQLRQSDRNAICGLWRQVAHYRIGAEISTGDHIGFIVSGWACRLRRLARDRKQIFSFLVPGDVVRHPCQQGSAQPFEIVCLTPVDVVDATVLLTPGLDGAEPCPALRRAATRSETHAERYLLDHLVRLGSRDAREGIAHLLLEFHSRMTSIGVADGMRFPLPIGQRPLSHAMGFSVVHVNRTLKHLREEGLVDFGAGWVRILEADRLAALAGLDE